jgi:hypothetical protein
LVLTTYGEVDFSGNVGSVGNQSSIISHILVSSHSQQVVFISGINCEPNMSVGDFFNSLVPPGLAGISSGQASCQSTIGIFWNPKSLATLEVLV